MSHSVTDANPLVAYDLGKVLLSCVEERLDLTWSSTPDAVPDPVPARSCLIAGAIAWDDCECGQLVLSVTGQWPSQSPPNGTINQSTPQSKCGAPYLVVSYTASILRCAPTGDESSPPACGELDAAARVSVVDAWAVRIGVTCCLRELATRTDGHKSIEGFVVGQQTMVGPDGACQGSDLPFQLWINSGCPCAEDGS